MIGTGLRRVLSLAAFLSLAVPGLALGQGFNNLGLPIIPLTVVNNFDTTMPVFVYIKGKVNPEDISPGSGIKTDDWFYVKDVSGNIDKIPPLLPDGTFTGRLALNLGTAQTTTLQFPKLNGVRIYFSFGAPTQVCCNRGESNVSPSEPIGWVPSEPNYNTLFDWVELAWDNGGNAGLGHKTRLGGNTTQVDMFGMPMHLVLSGQSTTGPGSSTQNAGFMDNRATIRKAYQQLGTKWTNLLITAGNPPRMLRAVSPFHGIQDLKVFPADELDSYINQVFTFYTTNTLSAKASCPQDLGIVHKLAGTVSGGNLVFTDSTGVSFMFPKPSTLRVYENEIKAMPPPSSELNACLGRVVAAKLGGAFIRTTLLTNTNLDAYCKMPMNFYINVPHQRYAQIFHTFGINHLAYSFGYDDTCDQSSYINVDDPTSMTVFVGGGG